MMKYLLWSGNKVDDYEKQPKFEISGLIFISIVFYLMYAIMTVCIYSNKAILYIVAYCVYLIALYLHLGLLGTGCFKYYSPYMMTVYKYNIFIFILKYVFYLNMAYIFNSYKDTSNLEKCKFTLLIEGIFILLTAILYKKEYGILKGIDKKKQNELKEKYYILCDDVEKSSIRDAMQIYNKDFCKNVFVNIAIITAISGTPCWIAAIIYTVVFYIYMFKKYKSTFSVVFRKNAILINVLCNVSAIIGQILIILHRTKVLEGLLFDIIGWIGILMISYIPFMVYYLKLNGLYKRTKCE